MVHCTISYATVRRDAMHHYHAHMALFVLHNMLHSSMCEAAHIAAVMQLELHNTH
jgi:hypothetical protein